MLAFLLLLISINSGFGESVHLDISDSITANAEYYPGDKARPSILIMHGFLLNHSFPTVKRLANSLNESGYNVLTPSLSLGINQRKKSLACEAIHTHSLEQDILEVGKWVAWLEKQSSKEIILIGHSTGSIHLANYLSQHPSEKISQIIFIAMPSFNYASRVKQTQEFQIKAKQLISSNDQTLYDFKLSYCEKYPTTAENYLSYLQLSKKNISLYLKKINIPKSLIIGTKDNRVDKSWNSTLVHYNTKVFQVDGADHFFDFKYEFDLLDVIESILSKNPSTINL